MKKFYVPMLAIALVACGDDTDTVDQTDDPISVDPGATIDPDGDGVAEAQSSSDGTTATVEVALAEPLPELDGLEREGETFRIDGLADPALRAVANALSLTIEGPSGFVADLQDGTLVAAPPQGPSEWSITMNNARTVISVAFTNSHMGLRLSEGKSYAVVWGLGPNEVIDPIPAQTLTFRLN